MSEWISVKDKLPEHGSIVAGINIYSVWDGCKTGDYDCTVFEFYNGKFLFRRDGLDASNYDGGAHISCEFEPTHWVELPHVMDIE